MSHILAMSLGGYLDFYGKFLLDQWKNMTPAGYGMLLVVIGAVGWLMMKSGTKGAGA